MVVKGTNKKTRVILDNVKDNDLIENLKFFGAKETKKSKRYSLFIFNRNKKKILKNLSIDIQAAAEESI